MQTSPKTILEAVTRRFSVLKNFLKLTRKHQCPSLFLSKVTGLKTAETLVQVFPCESSKKVLGTSFYRTPAVAESAFLCVFIKIIIVHHISHWVKSVRIRSYFGPNAGK